MTLTYNPRSVTRVEPFEIDAFDESTTLEGELDIFGDLYALLIALELDISITTAANPLHHGAAAIIDDINVKVNGSDEIISCEGYQAIQQSAMYTRRPPLNFIHGATGANQKIPVGILLPMQRAFKKDGDTIKLKIKTLTEIKIDGTIGNIVINDADVILEVAGIFGNIKDETFITNGSETFGTSNKEVRISGGGRFIEQIGITGDSELSGSEYDAVDRVRASLGSTVFYELNKTSMAVMGWYSASPMIAIDSYLGAAVSAFQDDIINRGSLIHLPTTENPADILLKLNRASSNNVFWSALSSVPIEGRGEPPVVQKTEPSSSKSIQAFA